jgi:hypothetical protein
MVRLINQNLTHLEDLDHLQMKMNPEIPKEYVHIEEEVKDVHSVEEIDELDVAIYVNNTNI